VGNKVHAVKSAARPQTDNPEWQRVWQVFFAGAFGTVLGLALIKFGNPVILDRLIEAPSGFWEYVFQPWPVRWGYGFLIGSVLLALPVVMRIRRGEATALKWVLVLPLPWFCWQLAASVGTVDARLTSATVAHFGACVLCYYLGLLVLSRVSNLKFFWIPMLLGLSYVLWMGIEQRYGGLEASRAAFFEQPDWERYPAEYIRKIESERIFSTLVYPNALAGALLLLMPVMLVMVWRMSVRFTPVARGVLIGSVAYAGLACLYWSGSKAGWLIAMALGVIVLLRLPLPKGLRVGIVGVILVGGLAGFFVKFAPYFGRGAPSVGARFEYWRAASQITVENPLLGSGPGTFSVPFGRIKPPEAEMARLVHNDYLEQASDSGLPGALAYALFVWGSMVFLLRKERIRNRPEMFAVWLGLFGWSMQSFVEFPLYIPALAWPAFAFFGWLWGRALPENSIDTT
jgi:hypothetical protein